MSQSLYLKLILQILDFVTLQKLKELELLKMIYNLYFYQQMDEKLIC